MRRGGRFFFGVSNYDTEDEQSEFIQACAAYGGLGGQVPRDFTLLDIAEKYHIKPWELPQAPALWVERMQFKMTIERQAQADREANQKDS